MPEVVNSLTIFHRFTSAKQAESSRERHGGRKSAFEGCGKDDALTVNRMPASETCAHKSRTSLCGRVSKTQPAWGSTRATCQFPKGAWQKRDAPALQAGPSGSVTRRPPAFAPCTAAGEGCRAEVRSTQAGMNRRTSGPRLGKPCRFDCGKLDQSTERSLINFLRWV